MTMPNHFNTPPLYPAANDTGTRHQQKHSPQQPARHLHQSASHARQHRSTHNSPRHSRPGTPLCPGTPVRIHSPLVPLSALHLTPIPVQPTLTLDIDSEAPIMSSGLQIHHPQPLTSAPGSPQIRPSSRSERLLRTTLLRDEVERKPLNDDPPSSASKTHRRRHSHAPVPTSPPPTGRPHSHSHSQSQIPSPFQAAAILEHYQATHPHSPTPPRSYQNAQSSHSDFDSDDNEDGDGSMTAAQYTLGSFLFRSAITSPTLASPPSKKKKLSSSSSSVVGRQRSSMPAVPFTPFAVGGAPTPAPSGPVNAYGKEAEGGLFGVSVAGYGSTAGKGKLESSGGDSGEFCLYHPNGHGHHATHIGRSLAQSRSISPSPAPDGLNSGVRRHKSLKTPGEQERLTRGRAGSAIEVIGGGGGEPLGMTPHELVLRARLERVLNTGKGIEEREMKKEERNRRSLERGRRERTSSNEVQDEQGGWPWRDKNNNNNKDNISTPNTPPDSSYNRSSVHSSSSSHHSSRHAQNNTNHPPVPPLPQQRSQPHSPGPQRSKTDPISHQSHSYSVPVTPRHTATFPPLHLSTITTTTPNIPSSTVQQVPSTTMSLLFSSKMVETPVDEHATGADQIMLTPPPTPPTITRGTLPSLLPYSPAAAAAAAAAASLDSQRRGSKSSSSCSSSENGVSGPTHRKRLSGSSIPSSSAAIGGGPSQSQRRGHHHRNSTSTATMTYSSDVTGSQTLGRRRASTATSRTRSVHSHHQTSSPVPPLPPFTPSTAAVATHGQSQAMRASSHTRSPSYSPQTDASRGRDREMPPPLDLDYTSGMTRPAFNTRKASAQCRAMEGYVSFASIEGLGEPPEGLNSPIVADGDDDDEEGRGRKGNGLMWRLGVSSLGWRKLLGGSTGGAEEGSNPAVAA
ncbi:hypothetical protein BDN72DRAFT_846142 [Pluteus cervinus]|uniref:Uncharacterized protein n=1 Tax=Pluteus cervinus TaxID=181527 RepID=A0ACD3AGU1_9AGAR|nr:hypothetical protein BDN72DRAFT_846142 [Pluteus cervinus]